jgi:hypothetical protein
MDYAQDICGVKLHESFEQLLAYLHKRIGMRP